MERRKRRKARSLMIPARPTWGSSMLEEMLAQRRIMPGTRPEGGARTHLAMTVAL
jgi:hypothetical protein